MICAIGDMWVHNHDEWEGMGIRWSQPGKNMGFSVIWHLENQLVSVTDVVELMQSVLNLRFSYVL